MANMRISGLASGMDIDSIVSDMMKVKRMPLDKLKQKRQTMEWQRDGYREMNALLLDFRSELTQMKLTTKYRTRTTTTTDDSKVTATASSAASLSSYSIKNVTQLATAASKVNAGAISDPGTKIDPNKSLHEIREQFASSDFGWNTGSVESGTITVTADNTSSVNLKLENGVQVKTADVANMSVKVNGKSYTVVTGETVQPTTDQVKIDVYGKLEFNNEVKFAKDTSIKVDYIAENKVDSFTFSEAANSFSLTKGSIADITEFKVKGEIYAASDIVKSSNSEWTIAGTEYKINPISGQITGLELNKGDSISVTYTQNYFNFKLGSYNEEGNPVKENFNIQGSESLNGVINKVNASDAGVSMFYDSFKDQVTLTRTETGDFNPIDNKIDVGEGTDGDEIITSGNFLVQVLKFDGTVAETGGKNAVFTINGLETERNSNTFDINGVTFTLKKEFSDSAATIAINNDTTAVYENIKGFIDKYNELIGKIQAKTQEERYKTYTPLTDEQREQLSDKQQEQWEEKAKSGMLRRDMTLTSLLSSMRMDFYGTVESEDTNSLYKQLTSIGINTKAYSRDGTLEINEAELKKAIEADPEAVENLFRATGTTNSQKGIAQRLYDTVGKTMDILYEKAGKSYSVNNQFTIGKQLDSLNDQIERFEDRLTAYEDRYYQQFTAMEKMIQQSNSQSTSLMQYFS
jgi:flagellar hook-associated protein 2